MKIPLIKPYIDNDIRSDVLKVLDSGYLTEGSVTKEFERQFSSYIGCLHSIAVTSCTTGLELAIRALGIGPGDEVIIPDFTYPATATAVMITGARPVIVDICRSTMLIDPEKVIRVINKNTRAIIPVSIFGNPLNYDVLRDIKQKYGIFIVEDAACSVGSEFSEVKTGNLADISVFSFHPRKFITTGEGGMITTNDDNKAAWMNSFKHFGMNMNNAAREGIQFEMAGTNYKLTNLQAAIGLAQLGKIEMLLQRRHELAANYKMLLENIRGISIPLITSGGKHSYQSFCIFIERRDEIMKAMRDEGIEVQIGTYSLHQHKAFRNPSAVSLSGSFENSLYAFENCLALPLYHELTFEMQDYIITKLKKQLNKR